MEIFHITAIAHEGKIIINIPSSLNGNEFDITVIKKDQENKKLQGLPREEKLRLLEQCKGSAKYPDTPLNKYEWYEQASDY